MKKIPHLPIAADISNEKLRTLSDAKLEALRNELCNLLEKYEGASSKAKQKPTQLAYEMDRTQTKELLAKIMAEIERRKAERSKKLVP